MLCKKPETAPKDSRNIPAETGLNKHGDKRGMSQASHGNLNQGSRPGEIVKAGTNSMEAKRVKKALGTAVQVLSEDGALSTIGQANLIQDMVDARRFTAKAWAYLYKLPADKLGNNSVARLLAELRSWTRLTGKMLTELSRLSLDNTDLQARIEAARQRVLEQEGEKDAV